MSYIDPTTIPPATSAVIGGVIVGDGLSVDAAGRIGITGGLGNKKLFIGGLEIYDGTNLPKIYMNSATSGDLVIEGSAISGVFIRETDNVRGIPILSWNSQTSLLTGSASLNVLKTGDIMTGNLTAPTFIGNLQGNVTGSASLNVLKTGDILTGNLTGPLFIGNLQGNVTGNVTGAASLNVLSTGGVMTGNLTGPKFIGNVQGNVTGYASLNLLKTGGDLTGNVNVLDSIISIKDTSTSASLNIGSADNRSYMSALGGGLPVEQMVLDINHTTGIAKFYGEFNGISTMHYTKEESDARFEPFDSCYTKAESDIRFGYSGSSYTKAESDARFEPIDTMYTKAESDAKYLILASGGTIGGNIITNGTVTMNGSIIMNGALDCNNSATVNSLTVDTTTTLNGTTTTKGLLTANGQITIAHAAPILTLSETETGTKALLVVDGAGGRLQRTDTVGPQILYWDATTAVFYGTATGHYTKAETDARYEPIDSAYTKAEADARFKPIAYNYVLPVATASVLGGIKVGANLTVDGTGILAGKDSYLKSETYSKTEADANFLTPAEGNALYEPLDSAYTKAESDARYEAINTMYTKAESDGKYVPKTGDSTLTGTFKTTGEYQSTSSTCYRMVSGNFGSFWHQNDLNFYLMATNSGNQYGSWSSMRPMQVNLSTGSVNLANSLFAFDGGNGNFTASGNITAYSDRRLKKDIVKLENAMDIINKLNGYKYKHIKDNRENIGVMAQEIEAVLPELITTSEETGMKSVAYGNLTAVLIEGLKETNKKIDEKDEKIEKLTQELKELRKAMKGFNELKSSALRLCEILAISAVIGLAILLKVVVL